jgi:hypothetical protein
VPGTAGTAGRGVLTGHGGACARMGFRAGSWPGRSGCGSDGLEGGKRWAGDEVKGGRADLGSWAVEKRRWAAVWELEGVAAAWRKKWGAAARLRELGWKWPWAKKEAEKKKRKRISFDFQNFIFGKRII